MSTRLVHSGGDDGVLPLSVRRGIALAVLLLHLWGLRVLQQWMAEASQRQPSQGFTVQFIAREALIERPIPAWPRVPKRDQAGGASVPAAANGRSAPAPKHTTPVLPFEPSVAPRWIAPDGRSLLALPDRLAAPAEWSAADRLLRSRTTRLPGGSDSAAAEHVRLRLRAALAPEDVLLAVVNFFVGAPTPDDCGVIEQRLALSDPGVSREIELNKFNRLCRGGGRRDGGRLPGETRQCAAQLGAMSLKLDGCAAK